MSQGILLPEFVIHKTLVSIVELLRSDLAQNAADDTKSLLYKILGLTRKCASTQSLQRIQASKENHTNEK